jgi:putative acetyltransferase
MIEVRRAVASDIEVIARIHATAFGSPLEARLVKRLHEARKAVISLVAVSDGQFIGSIIFSPVAITGAPMHTRVLGLAPVGVLPEFQKRGVGSLLVRAGLQEARRLNYDAVVVLGDPRFYSRFGFSPAAKFGLNNEYGLKDEFMAMEMKAGVLAGVRGLVRYSKEFQEVDV